MNSSRCVLLTVVAAAVAGCGGGTPATGTFAASATPQQLVAGQKQEVELTVHYTLPSNPPTATTVSYKVQLTAPPGWAIDTIGWEFNQPMKTTDIGFNEKRKVSIMVPADAALGEHVVK